MLEPNYERPKCQASLIGQNNNSRFNWQKPLVKIFILVFKDSIRFLKGV